MLTLHGASTYSGPTTVSTGTLMAGAAATLSASSAFTVDNGGTLDVAAGRQTVNSLTVGSSGSLNLMIGNVLTSTNAASLSGTLNLFGTLTGGTRT